jgi:hypothetical protein
VRLSPSNSASIRPGWRIAGNQNTNFITNALSTVALIGGGGYPVEFKSIPGFITPSNRIIQMAVGGKVSIQADYVPASQQLSLNSMAGLTLLGGAGARYRVDFATNLTPPPAWMPLTTFTLSGSSLLLTNTRPTNAGSRFYRSVLVP